MFLCNDNNSPWRQEPNLPRKVVNYTRAVVKHAADGDKKLDQTAYEEP